MNDRAATGRGGRWPLVALLALFLVPAVAAWLLASGALGWRPARLVNHGELLDPPLAVLADGIGLRPRAPGHWLLLLVVPRDCDDACRALIDTIDHVRQATGRESWRVQAAVAAASPPPNLPPGMATIDLARLPGEVVATTDGRPVLLAVDYRGVAVLRYCWPIDARGALKDLERLLRATRPVTP